MYKRSRQLGEIERAAFRGVSILVSKTAIVRRLERHVNRSPKSLTFLLLRIFTIKLKLNNQANLWLETSIEKKLFVASVSSERVFHIDFFFSNSDSNFIVFSVPMRVSSHCSRRWTSCLKTEAEGSVVFFFLTQLSLLGFAFFCVSGLRFLPNDTQRAEGFYLISFFLNYIHVIVYYCGLKMLACVRNSSSR